MPGDQIEYRARIESIDDHAAATSGDVLINHRRIGSIDLMFSYIPPGGMEGLPDDNFVFTPSFMDLFNAIRRHNSNEARE